MLQTSTFPRRLTINGPLFTNVSGGEDWRRKKRKQNHFVSCQLECRPFSFDDALNPTSNDFSKAGRRRPCIRTPV